MVRIRHLLVLSLLALVLACARGRGSRHAIIVKRDARPDAPPSAPTSAPTPACGSSSTLRCRERGRLGSRRASRRRRCGRSRRPGRRLRRARPRRQCAPSARTRTSLTSGASRTSARRSSASDAHPRRRHRTWTPRLAVSTGAGSTSRSSIRRRRGARGPRRPDPAGLGLRRERRDPQRRRTATAPTSAGRSRRLAATTSASPASRPARRSFPPRPRRRGQRPTPTSSRRSTTPATGRSDRQREPRRRRLLQTRARRDRGQPADALRRRRRQRRRDEIGDDNDNPTGRDVPCAYDLGERRSASAHRTIATLAASSRTSAPSSVDVFAPGASILSTMPVARRYDQDCSRRHVDGRTARRRQRRAPARARSRELNDPRRSRARS